MAQVIKLEERLTSRYVDSYRHMDQWGREFTFKVLPAKMVEERFGYDEGNITHMRVIGSKTIDQNAQIRVLHQNMGYSGCSHEYDCCGCASVHTDIKKVKRGIFSVLLTVSKNY